jgi:hypothetical protein
VGAAGRGAGAGRRVRVAREARRDGDALVFESTRGFARFLHARGYSAITLGQVITSHGPMSSRTRRHEGEHVRQWTRGGLVFALLYLLEGVRCLVLRRNAYRDNVFERRARAAE